MILSQPRSRSKWLSEYLSRDGVRCGHDLVLGCSSVNEFITKIKDYSGTVETSVGLGWKLWIRLLPNTSFAVLLRSMPEIAESLTRFEPGANPDWVFILSHDIVLRQFYEKVSTVHMFHFRDLGDPDERRRVCEFAGIEFDEHWDREMNRRNIQVNSKERLAQIYANVDNTRAFVADMAKQTALIRRDR